jgi:hypothetical protein
MAPLLSSLLTMVAALIIRRLEKRWDKKKEANQAKKN